MKKSALAFLCLISLAASIAAQIPVPGAINPQTYTSSQGKARVEKKPDVAYITFYVKASAPLATEAMKQLDDSTEAVIDALKQTGKSKIRSITKEFIKLGDKENFNPNSNKISPVAINRITLTTDPSIETAAELIDVIIGNGASLKSDSNVFSQDNAANSAVVFGLENFADAEKEATDKAVEDAKTNAQRVADMSGKKIGKTVSVNPNMNYAWNVNNMQRKFKARYISADFEKIPVEISVNVSFQLVDK